MPLVALSFRGRTQVQGPNAASDLDDDLKVDPDALRLGPGPRLLLNFPESNQRKGEIMEVCLLTRDTSVLLVRSGTPHSGGPAPAVPVFYSKQEQDRGVPVVNLEVAWPATYQWSTPSWYWVALY